MNETLVGNYNLQLVALSFAIATVASYTALDLAGRVHGTSELRSRWIWICGGAVAMGTGIWSMHFIAMLAFKLPIAVSYNITITLLSLLVAIAASGVALLLFSRPCLNLKVLGGGSIVMGFAIASMHYVGMAAMNVPAIVHYDWVRVVLSIAIAIAASGAALGLAFRFRSSTDLALEFLLKSASALVMGLAISGMHYTGMWATCFQRMPQLETTFTGTVDNSWLGMQIGIGTLVFLTGTLMTALFDRRFAAQLVWQEAIAESETRFRSLIREMPVGILLLDGKGKIILTNQTALELLDLVRYDLQEKTVFNLQVKWVNEKGKVIPQVEHPIQRAIALQQPMDQTIGIYRCGKPDPLWLLLNADPQIGANGQIESVVCTLSDITERKRAEKALQESAEREKAVTQAIERIRQTLDIETIFNATTQELRQVLNCDRVAIYRFNPDWSGEFVSESVADGWTSLLEAQQRDRSIKGGLLSQENCAIKTLASTGYSTFKFVEDTYLQETAGGAYTRGASYRSVSDIYQSKFSDCYLQLLERFQARAYIIVPIFCGNKLWGLLANYQNSSSRIWCEAEIGIATQISAQLGVALQQAELFSQTQKQSEELQKAAIAADAANRAKSEFLAKMSHELRTPLNAIIGFTELMSRDLCLSSQHQEHLNIVNHAGEHLLKLIDDILEMSKIEAGRITLNENSFDLYQLLDTLYQMLMLKIRKKGLKLIFDCASDVPQYIKADEGKLRQILINLLGNAIKFTEVGQVTLRVKREVQFVQHKPEKNKIEEISLNVLLPLQLQFEIEDTGPGIAVEEMEELFQPFVQTETGRKSQKGTGLGLSIGRKFVQMMGGELTVRSELDRGSVFAFEIVAAVGQAPKPSADRSKGKPIGIAGDRNEYRILVVEDVKTNRLLLVKQLSALGFQVREALNGVDAIAVWESWQPDLILMDMQMPVMDGYEATKRIKTDPKGRNTIIIAITASAFEEERQKIFSAGCDDCLRKPFNWDGLLTTLEEYLGVRYLYENTLECHNSDGQLKSEEVTVPHPLEFYLSQMPSEWIKRVNKAANECSDDKILNLLEEIPAHCEPLARAFRKLAHNFLFDELIELTTISEGDLSSPSARQPVARSRRSRS